MYLVSLLQNEANCPSACMSDRQSRSYLEQQHASSLFTVIPKATCLISPSILVLPRFDNTWTQERERGVREREKTSKNCCCLMAVLNYILVGCRNVNYVYLYYALRWWMENRRWHAASDNVIAERNWLVAVLCLATFFFFLIHPKCRIPFN